MKAQPALADWINWRHAVFSLLLLATVTAVGMLLLREQQAHEPGLAEQASQTADGSDYYMEGVVMQRFDASGQLHQTLQSPRIAHDPLQAQLQLQAPRLRVNSLQQKQWLLQADDATADEALQQISLRGKVLVQRKNGGQIDLGLSTDKLQINSHTQMASTTDAVTLSTHNGELHAQGLNADLAHEKLELLHAVHARYVHP